MKGTYTANYKILDTLHLKTITVFLISKFEKKGQTLTLSKFKWSWLILRSWCQWRVELEKIVRSMCFTYIKLEIDRYLYGQNYRVRLDMGYMPFACFLTAEIRKLKNFYFKIVTCGWGGGGHVPGIYCVFLYMRNIILAMFAFNCSAWQSQFLFQKFMTNMKCRY